MPISPLSLDLLTKMATGDFHPRNLPVPPEDTIESHLAEKNVLPACPRCGGTDIKKNGKQANRQRLRCKRCGKTFGLSSGTPYYRSKLPFSTWREIIRGIETKTPLREIAEQTGISLHTVCKLRQKYLAMHMNLLVEILDEMQTRGLVKQEANLDNLHRLYKDEIDKTYRGRSKRLAKERFLRWQVKFLEKLEKRNRRGTTLQFKNQQE